MMLLLAEYRASIECHNGSYNIYAETVAFIQPTDTAQLEWVDPQASIDQQKEVTVPVERDGSN